MPDDCQEVGDHHHAYEVMSSGSSHWAECACGENLAGENGPIVGSKAKLERAVAL